jgi:all-trans-retinol 13,14-reductase
VRLQQAIDEQFPWLTPTIRRIWMASPLTFRDYLGGRHGGAMGLSQNLGHLGDSPLQSRNRLRNLFMIGQSITHPGIQGCLVGACILAGGILQRDVRQELSA